MIDTDRTLRKERRKGCHIIALQRARMARKQGRGRLVALLIFLWAILSGSFPSPSVASLPTRGLSPVPRPSDETAGDDWPVTDHERGLGGDILLPPRRLASGTGRYRARPTLTRLMADLRRPAARDDAARALLTGISDPATRKWAAEQIARDQVNRLSIWVRPGRTETDILIAWRDEADAALAEEQAAVTSPSPDRGSLLDVAKLLEALAGTETVTASGPKPPGEI